MFRSLLQIYFTQLSYFFWKRFLSSPYGSLFSSVFLLHPQIYLVLENAAGKGRMLGRFHVERDKTKRDSGDREGKERGQRRGKMQNRRKWKRCLCFRVKKSGLWSKINFWIKSGITICQLNFWRNFHYKNGKKDKQNPRYYVKESL